MREECEVHAATEQAVSSVGECLSISANKADTTGTNIYCTRRNFISEFPDPRNNGSPASILTSITSDIATLPLPYT